MNDLLSYNLTQFIMVSPEVFQDLHQRYFSALWPWFGFFIVANVLVLFKKYRHFLPVYIAFSWLFIAAFYFSHYVTQVHTQSWLWMILFAIQAGIVLIYKNIFSNFLLIQESTSARLFVSRLGLFIFGLSAFIPVSVFLENSKGTLLLFGWGAEQTALGTIGLIVSCFNRKREMLLAFIPVLWLIFYLLFL